MATMPNPGESSEPQAPKLLNRLDGFRRQMVWTVVGVATACVVSFSFGQKLLWWLAQPLCKAYLSVDPPKSCNAGDAILYPSDLIETFIVQLKLGIVVGLLVSAPFILMRLWKVFAPVMLQKERRMVVAFTFTAVVLFAGGSTFGYTLVFPLSFAFLLSFNPTWAPPLISISSYFNITMLLLLAFGIAFELPLAMVLVARLGLVNYKQFAKVRRYAIIALMTLSAILTPQDPGSMVLMALPLCVLYEIGIIGARLLGRSAPWQPAQAQASDEDESEG